MAIPTQILFIDEDYVKRFSSVNGSVDPKFLEPGILTAQDLWIQSLLGTNLFVTIKTMISDGTILLAPQLVYRTLLEDYIQRATLHWTLIEVYPMLLYKVNNGSLSSFSSEDSTAITRGELDRLIEEQRSKAQFYSERLIDYLCVNGSDFPEYNTQTSSAGICPIKESIYYEGGMDIG